MSKPFGIFAFFFLTVLGLHCQITTDRISLELQDVSIPEALNKFATESQYRIFFQEEWFTDEKVSRTYENQTPDAILGDLLEGSEVNYYRYGPKSFVLTRNNSIYDQLPEDFFGKRPDSLEPTQTEGRTPLVTGVTPVFVNQEDLASVREVETIRIGKQNLSDPLAYTLQPR